MECHIIDLVLNRDQRTIKICPKFDVEIVENVDINNNCSHCLNKKNTSSLLLTNILNYGSSIISSLINYATYCHHHHYHHHHQQYCRTKRLKIQHQTETVNNNKNNHHHHDKCSISRNCAKNLTISNQAWMKRSHKFLVIISYLSLITFPIVSAVPTPISSREVLLRSSRNTMMASEDLTKTLTNTYRCANWALIKARHLKTLFQEQAKSDLEQVYKNVVYEWLPNIPKFENQSIERYLSGKSLEDITKDIAEKTQLMVAPVELAISDSDGKILDELKVMHGLLGNMLEELNYTLNISEENINLIPGDLKGVDQTSRSLRDWLFIRSLVEVLEYAVAVFEHFGVTLEVN